MRRGLARLGAAVWSLCAAAQVTEARATPSVQNNSNYGGGVQASDTVAATVLGPGNGLDTAFDDWNAWKAESGIPVNMGAYHWFHVNNGGPYPTGYGIPGIRGTYFYYLQLDPQTKTGDAAIPNVGLHVDFRFRDSSEPLRPFYDNPYWFQELYGWIDTGFGRIKLGQIWKRFGLDWDNSWWGSVPYFDAFKANPDYGMSWERHGTVSGNLQLDSYVQYFAAQDGVNGSVVGSDPESVPGAKVRNGGVVRLVPTWTFADLSTLSVGTSVLAREILGITPSGGGNTQEAFGFDVNYTKDAVNIFSEALRSYGIVNPVRYVSGGPSNRINDFLAGASYRYGPMLFRFSWSAGFDEHPSGHQYLSIPGVTWTLTKNLSLYTEYVRWDITRSTGQHVTAEDGGQLVLYWHL